MLKIRIFGSNNCPKCDRLTDALKKHNISYAFVDALADDTQDFCDEHNVDDLPHIQLINDANKVIFEHIGYISPMKIQKVVAAHGS